MTMRVLRASMLLALLLSASAFAQDEAAAPEMPAESGEMPAESGEMPAESGEMPAEAAETAADSAETATEPETIGADCMPNENNEFVFKVNLWEYQYGVEGCDGVAPTLKIQRGQEYTMVQNDATNWFHPLGLAYSPDGAHT